MLRFFAICFVAALFPMETKAQCATPTCITGEMIGLGQNASVNNAVVNSQMNLFTGQNVSTQSAAAQAAADAAEAAAEAANAARAAANAAARAANAFGATQEVIDAANNAAVAANNAAAQANNAVTSAGASASATSNVNSNAGSSASSTAASADAALDAALEAANAARAADATAEADAARDAVRDARAAVRAANTAAAAALGCDTATPVGAGAYVYRWYSPHKDGHNIRYLDRFCLIQGCHFDIDISTTRTNPITGVVGRGPTAPRFARVRNPTCAVP